MDFVNPALLFGCAAAAVPIVLHLIMRQKPRPLEFPALRFVQRRQEANRRQLRLRHLLLLAARVAALVLLALALARPSIKTSGTFVDQKAPVAAAFVFDTSPRMEYRDQNQSRLEAARAISSWLLGQLPPDSQVAVLESGHGSAMFQVDLGAAQDRIERLETTGVPQPLEKVLADAAALLQTSPLENREIYVFTDLAAAAWPRQAAGLLKERLGKLDGVPVHLIDVGVEKPRNFALGDVRLSSQVLSKNAPLRIETTLSGPAGSRTVELWMLAEDDTDGQRKLRKRGVESRQLADGHPQAVSFRLGGLEAGTHQGLLRIVGEDALAVDDVRFFSVEVKSAWPVLVAAPSPAEEHAFFFTEAIAPQHFRKNDQARFKPDIIALEELPRRSLEKYAAVCLVDPAPLSAETWRKLRDFAAQGGGVLVFLGRNAEQMESFNSPTAQELLPGKLLQQARRPGGQIHLAPESYDHPLLAKFRSMAGSIPWEGYPVFRYWQLEKLHEGVGVVLPFSDGAPALLERPVGKGRAVTMTTPVSDQASAADAWNLIPTGTIEFEPWPFVILANETLLYLVGSTDGQLNYQAGQTAVLRLDAAEPNTTYLLSLPAKNAWADPLEAVTQAGEQLRRSIDTRLHAIVEAGTERPGNYRVRAGGGEERLDRGFSVNLPVEASRLERIEPEALQEVFGEVPYRLARSREEIDRDISISRVGRELFPLLILLVAALLGLEHVLANRFYKGERG